MLYVVNDREGACRVAEVAKTAGVVIMDAYLIQVEEVKSYAWEFIKGVGYGR